MKLVKSLLAVSVLGTAVQANAISYNVQGALQGINTVGASVDPILVVHAGSTAYNIATPSQVLPTFTGLWDISLGAGGNTPSISGTFANFVQYSTSINTGVLIATAVINQPNSILNFSSGTVTYDQATRTLTLGQVLNYSATDSLVNNDQTSDAGLSFTGTPGVCNGSAAICTRQSTWFTGPHADVERFYLTLTFASDFLSFTGSAVGVDVSGAQPLGDIGNTWYSYSFSSDVPVPASAWLFASGLIGLASASRRRVFNRDATQLSSNR